MANKMVANVGAAISVVLALLWTITLTVPWNWIWSQNPIVIFKVNLLSLYVGKGLVAHAFSGMVGVFSKNAKASLTALFQRSISLEEGVQELCMTGVDTIWHWCDVWTMVKYGSFIMLFLGFTAVLLLAAGGAFMYYYTHEHATHTGRIWIRTCFIAAPCCAVIGVLQYVMMTFQMGKGSNQFLQTSASYGPGFIIACALTLFSFIPLYIFAVFSKVDDSEKYGDSEAFMVSDGGYGYGAAQMAVPEGGYGYGAAQAGLPPAPFPVPPHTGYDATGQPLPPPDYAPMGPAGAPFPPGQLAAPPASMPGTGAPAW